MQETFTQSVISRYPALFDISDAGDDAIARYGIEIFPGWFSIVERMVDQINTFANQRNYIGSLKITQIKSKFCTLRCATNIQDDDLGQIIGQYEKQASETCEQCGMPGKIRMNRQWKMVLCAVCEMKG
jgi:hypothetical protein